MSRQRINLHQVAARNPDLLSAGGMIGVLGALTLFLALASVWLAWDVRGSERVNAELAESVRALESQVARMRDVLPADSPDAALAADIRELERRLERGERLLAALGERVTDNPSGFSPVLVSLAREPLDGVWLERIVVAPQGGLLFEGRATDPDRIPRFVEQLSREPELIGRSFRTLRIERDNGETRSVKFALVGMGVSDEQ